MGPARFSLERFESIATTPRHALLRLRGRWPASVPVTLTAPQLVVTVGDQAQRYAPLDPREATIVAGPEPELWRCAYAVPAALLDDGAAEFALVGTTGSLELPAPIGLEPGDPATDEAMRLRERRETPDRRGGDDRRTQDEPPAEGTERRGDSRRSHPDRRRRRSRAELDAFARQVRELEVAAAQHLAAVEGDLVEARAALFEAEERGERLEARAAETGEHVESLEQAVADAAERAASLEHEAQAAQARAETLDTEVLARAERLEADRDDLARRLADGEAALALAQERAEELERQVAELEARGRELEARVAEAGSEAAARVEEAQQQAQAETTRLREQLSEVRAQARRELRDAQRNLEAQPATANGGKGDDAGDPHVADLVAQLEDQAHFVEQAGASLWATESELAEVRASQSMLMAEREEATRRARESSERAARLAAQLRELEGEAPS